MRTMIVMGVAAVLAAACGKGDKGKVDPDDLEYLKKSKASEGDLQIDNIAGRAKKYFYVHDNAFPVGTAAATPAQPCCAASPDHMCQPNAADWADGVWNDLHFKMTDKPYRFQYAYQGTATEFTATATGDLDCDGTNETTITAHGHVVAGEPQIEITRDAGH